MRWVFALVAVAVPAVACTEHDVAIRFLRSDTYSFSRAERNLIEDIAGSATHEVRRLLPGLSPTIELTVRPGSDVIAETGETASAMPPAGVMWTVDPTRPGGVEAVAKTWLRATLFHELHHLVRSAAGNPRSMLDRAVFEGMATVFERDFAGARVPWGVYPGNVEDWALELANLPDDAPVGEWLYTHPDGRRWIGIRVGAFWVDRVVATSGRSAADLVSTPTNEILSWAGVSSLISR